jgi:Flp pilus assembly protein TadD
MMLARTYASRGRLDDALRQYDSVIQKQPKSVGARTMAALIVEAQGRRDEAVKRYESVLALDERAPVAANNLAFHLADRGTNLDKALQLAQAAIAAAPDVATVNDTLGWVYYKKNLQTLAVPAFEKALKAEPNNAVFHYHLGAAYAAAGDKPKARQSLSRAIDLKLGSEDAARAKSLLASLQS